MKNDTLIKVARCSDLSDSEKVTVISKLLQPDVPDETLIQFRCVPKEVYYAQLAEAERLALVSFNKTKEEKTKKDVPIRTAVDVIKYYRQTYVSAFNRKPPISPTDYRMVKIMLRKMSGAALRREIELFLSHSKNHIGKDITGLHKRLQKKEAKLAENPDV